MKPSLTVVLIEDEVFALNSLKILLDHYCPEVEVIGTASSVATAIELIPKLKPDAVFLDIELPDGTGFDILDHLLTFDFKVVFTTAFEQYALQALKQSAVDYLVKPIDADDLVQAVEKLLQEKEQAIPNPILPAARQRTKSNRIMIPGKDSFRVIKIEDLIRCEADNNYTLFHLKSEEALLVSRTLKDYEKALEAFDFLRIHQSHLVNLACVVRYFAGRGGNIELEDGTVLPVSRDKKGVLLNHLDITRDL